MLAASLGLSVIAMVTTLVARAVGVTDLSAGLWPVIVILPGVGLPLSFALLLALILISAVRRSRAARNATE